MLDQWFPRRGPCGICGGPDARHRLGDAIYGGWRAGDSALSLAKDYRLKNRAIVACLVEYERSRRAHKRRPFQEALA